MHDPSDDRPTPDRPTATALPGVGPSRVFRAAGIREAFARVKDEIGPDAIILATRDVSRWESDPQQRYEVVAAYPSPPARPADAPREPAPRAPATSPGPLARESHAREPGPRGGADVRPWTPGTPPGERHPRASEPQDPGERQLSALQSAIQALESQLGGVLDQNRAMHDELSKLSRTRVAAEASAPTTESAALLVAAGVDRDVAEHIVTAAARRAAPRRGVAVARPPDLAQEIERALRVGKPLWHQPSGTVCAFVGPTGVGKTTTLLKVAGLARFVHGRTVGCISTDVHRIGTWEQLEMYAHVMGLPVLPAADRDAVDRALDAMSHLDLVLIDTPGHNPFDPAARHAALKPIASREVTQHLVLSATLASGLIADVIESYSGPALTSLILTKLDEARGLGALLATAVVSELPVSHLCDGQDVPDAISAVDRAQVTRELLARAS